MQPTQDETTASFFERAIDQKGLDGVLEILANICAEKAEHIQVNWQDSQSAKVWDGQAKVLMALSQRICD